MKTLRIVTLGAALTLSLGLAGGAVTQDAMAQPKGPAKAAPGKPAPAAPKGKKDDKKPASAAEAPATKKFCEETGEQIVIRKGAELRRMLEAEYSALGAVAKSLNLTQ